MNDPLYRLFRAGLERSAPSRLHRPASWHLLASARNPTKLKQANNAGITMEQLDIASGESIAVSATAAEKLTGGSLDAVVGNASKAAVARALGRANPPYRVLRGRHATEVR